MLNKLDLKRQRRQDLQKVALATESNPQKSRQQTLQEKQRTMEEIEQMEVRRLKEQIRLEKEKVVAYWRMLQDGVDLEDEELAQIMRDLSECGSEEGSSAQQEP